MWLTLTLAVFWGNVRCLGRFVVLAIARVARSNNGDRHER